jgi:hypothetical protein
MLEPDPKQRINAAAILSHPWFQINFDNPTEIHADVSNNLRQSIKTQNIAINLLVASFFF